MNKRSKRPGLFYKLIATVMLKRCLLFIATTTAILMFNGKVSHAQQPVGERLTLEDFFRIILKYHPVAKLADINIEKSNADVLIARGNFDPLATITTARKTFDGTEYYDHVQPELRIPTWYGIELIAGAEYLSGQRTNNEETIGKSSYAGAVLPLAKNLFMDKRRATLQTAKIFRDLSEVEKRSTLNTLLRDAAAVYWNWTLQYQQYKVLSDAVLVNEKKLRLIKNAFLQGDRPAMDTTEALTQLQQFQFSQTEAFLQWQNAGLELSVFLWKENNEAYLISSNTIPDTILLMQRHKSNDIPSLTDLLENARNNHPDLLQYPLKLDALVIERKLKFQELLPKLDLKYNQLGKGYDILNAKSGPLFTNNYQFGIAFGIPLRLSHGRGEYKNAKLKIEATRMEQSWKTVQVETKIRSYYNELLTLSSQAELMHQAYQNFLTLQKGEELKFYNGESSLFMVNSRENKTLEALQKLLKTRAQYEKTLVETLWAAGQLIN